MVRIIRMSDIGNDYGFIDGKVDGWFTYNNNNEETENDEVNDNEEEDGEEYEPRVSFPRNSQQARHSKAQKGYHD